MVISIDGEIFPNLAIHPGELLGEELDERGIAVDSFASAIGCPRGHVLDLIEGRANFDAAVSVAIERALGISARFWMTRQATYELILAYNAAEEHEKRAVRAS